MPTLASHADSFDFKSSYVNCWDFRLRTKVIAMEIPLSLAHMHVAQNTRGHMTPYRCTRIAPAIRLIQLWIIQLAGEVKLKLFQALLPQISKLNYFHNCIFMLGHSTHAWTPRAQTFSSLSISVITAAVCEKNLPWTFLLLPPGLWGTFDTYSRGKCAAFEAEPSSKADTVLKRYSTVWRSSCADVLALLPERSTLPYKGLRAFCVVLRCRLSGSVLNRPARESGPASLCRLMTM